MSSAAAVRWRHSGGADEVDRREATLVVANASFVPFLVYWHLLL